MGTSRLYVCVPCKGVWQGRACMQRSGEVLGVQHLLHCMRHPSAPGAGSGAWQSVRPVTAAGAAGVAVCIILPRPPLSTPHRLMDWKLQLPCLQQTAASRATSAAGPERQVAGWGCVSASDVMRRWKLPAGGGHLMHSQHSCRLVQLHAPCTTPATLFAAAAGTCWLSPRGLLAVCADLPLGCQLPAQGSWSEGC